MFDERDAFYAAACEILRHVDILGLTWRHHGLGMLQGEINGELRVHVWHPKLRTIGVEDFRSVHDHRFDLVSAVVVGAIHDESWAVEEAVTGDPLGYPSGGNNYRPTEMFAIRHAKIQTGNGDSESLGKVFAAPFRRRSFNAGQAYNIPRRQFHTTVTKDLAVTMIYRGNVDDDRPARVLGNGRSAIVTDDGIEIRAVRSEILRMAAGAVRLAVAA